MRRSLGLETETRAQAPKGKDQRQGGNLAHTFVLSQAVLVEERAAEFLASRMIFTGVEWVHVHQGRWKGGGGYSAVRLHRGKPPIQRYST